jgi:hypothetical protein
MKQCWNDCATNPFVLSLKSTFKRDIAMEYWNNNDREHRNTPKCLFIHHKSYAPGSNPGPYTNRVANNRLNCETVLVFRRSALWHMQLSSYCIRTRGVFIQMPVRACSLDEEGLLRIIRNTLKHGHTFCWENTIFNVKSGGVHITYNVKSGGVHTTTSFKALKNTKCSRL